MTWTRVTYPAPLEGGGTRRVSVILRDPTVRETVFAGAPSVVISGRECTRDGDLTDREQIIFTAPGEARMVDLTQDLVTLHLVTPERESAYSRKMRNRE